MDSYSMSRGVADVINVPTGYEISIENSLTTMKKILAVRYIVTAFVSINLGIIK